MSNTTRIVWNGMNERPVNNGVIASGLEKILSGIGPLGFLGLGTLFLQNCRLEPLKAR